MKPIVLLISPKGAANLGGVARLMGNFGLDELRIVAPRCELDDPECKMRSLRSYHLIESAKVYTSFEEAIGDLKYCVGFSMQSQEVSVPHHSLDSYFESIADEFPTQKWALCFGREDNGMEAAELLKCNDIVWIPTTDDYPSINLTSSVAIALYSWFSKLSNSSLNSRGQWVPPKKKDEEVFFEGLKMLLKELDFMKTPRDHILDDLRNMYRRARISERDLRILFGVLSDMGRHCNKRFFPKNGKL